jgi:hypothetical protein
MTERLQRERRTVAAMIKLFCQAHHGDGKELCAACAELQRYCEARLSHCPFHADKPSCAQCTVHCYAPKQREQIRQVMRYAGPRMLGRHPLLAIGHLLDKRRAPSPPPA